MTTEEEGTTTAPKVAPKVTKGIVVTPVAAIAALVVLLSIATATVFGVMWVAANAKASDLEVELSKANASVTALKADRADGIEALAALERDALYTACVDYIGGFTQGQGFGVEIAMSVASDLCADESDWTFEIKPAP